MCRKLLTCMDVFLGTYNAPGEALALEWPEDVSAAWQRVRDSAQAVAAAVVQGMA
ncbi:hypothetical protein AB0I53_46655 [Saccharopolyspora sp. NPDC050389]|uniref:hypothetical protein n=1 Tax=Saccharopolyspora sp. NPDC050389 TaxID=3155516 RepID=UPI0033D00C3D